MAQTRKPSAAERTVDMFAEPPKQDDREIEVLQDDAKGERKSMEEDADRNREQAFRYQEWCTNAFGKAESDGHEYRVTRSGSYFYIEVLKKQRGAKEAYGYTGHMVHKDDYINFATQVVLAAKALKQEQGK